MKKLIFITAITFCAMHLKAITLLKTEEVKTDTAQRSKQIRKLNLKLADLNSEVLDTRTKIPVDSVQLESALAKSHEAQVKSKKRSGQAVGGDMDDVKLAEKQAKKAAKETSEAEDAAKQLERDRKKLKNLLKQIDKTQQDLQKAATIS